MSFPLVEICELDSTRTNQGVGRGVMGCQTPPQLRSSAVFFHYTWWCMLVNCVCCTSEFDCYQWLSNRSRVHQICIPLGSLQCSPDPL